jgi:hypothetical protein
MSIVLENDAQTIGQVTDLLAQNCINIRALSLTEKGPASLLHLIVNDTEKARKIFLAGGQEVTTTDVLVIEIPDKPGGLASIMRSLKPSPLKILYLSAFSRKSGEYGLVVLRFDDLEQAVKIMEKSGIHPLSHEELFAR